MKDHIATIVRECLIEINKGIGSEELANPTMETRLYGAKSSLDSIGLVNLIADVEERIAQEFGKDILLADERAMSQTRSPFGRVGTLVEYIEQLLADAPKK